MITAKEEIKKQIKVFSKYIRKYDKEITYITHTYNTDIEQATRLGWERGLSWALTAIELEESGELEMVLNALKSKSGKKKFDVDDSGWKS